MVRVLVVEDEANIREMIALNLRLTGMEAVEAESAEAALPLLVIHGLRRNEELDMLNTYHDNFGDPADDAPAQPAAPQPTENQ